MTQFTPGDQIVALKNFPARSPALYGAVRKGMRGVYIGQSDFDRENKTGKANVVFVGSRHHRVRLKHIAHT